MFAPGKGLLEIGAGGGDGKSFISLTELVFEAVSEGFSPCLSCWWRVAGEGKVSTRRGCVSRRRLLLFVAPTPGPRNTV